MQIGKWREKDSLGVTPHTNGVIKPQQVVQAPGIPQKHWDDLFLAFRSKQRGGSVLGLAIARDLAVAQGGNLKLARSNDDGSEFRLQLPLQVLSITDDED